jgi:hypothetical protein
MRAPYCFRNWLRQNNGNDVPLDTIDVLDGEAGSADFWLAEIDIR